MTDATTIPCARCEATIGEPCKTISGKRATYSHAGRQRPLNEAWREGYYEGVRIAVERPDYAHRIVATDAE
jgi:hypothetical protein